MQFLLFEEKYIQNVQYIASATTADVRRKIIKIGNI